jgi:hypothetical protein
MQGKAIAKTVNILHQLVDQSVVLEMRWIEDIRPCKGLFFPSPGPDCSAFIRARTDGLCVGKEVAWAGSPVPNFPGPVLHWVMGRDLEELNVVGKDVEEEILPEDRLENISARTSLS